MRQKIVFGLVFLSFTLFSCSKSFRTQVLNLDKNELDKVVCSEQYELTMDFFISIIDKTSPEILSSHELDSSQPNRDEKPSNDMILNAISEDEFNQISGNFIHPNNFSNESVYDKNIDQYAEKVQEELKKDLYSIYLGLISDLNKLSKEEKNTNFSELATMIRLEDKSSDLRQGIIEKNISQLADLKNKYMQKGLLCSENKNVSTVRAPSSEPIATDGKNSNSNISDIKRAMQKLFAVTYQSCDVLKQKPLDESQDPVKGIASRCCNGRGQIRSISNLNSLLDTHYYLQNPKTDSSCFPIKENPLIYDYGGRPFHTKGTLGTLNFFKNNQDGLTKVLGYDCSALVYTVLLGGGFRLKENKVFLASDVSGARSSQFIAPEKNYWNCINKIEMNESETIKEGDIFAYDGHIIMAYNVYDDPFGIKDLNDCSQVSISKFNFDVMQSSPSKGGIGVNVYKASSYLKDDLKMRQGLLAYAQSACTVLKSKNKIKLNLKDFSITRVSDKSECRGSKVVFENQACVIGDCIQE